MALFSRIAGITAVSLIALVVGQTVPAAAQVTIGANFTGQNISGSGFYPPDTDGAVGPTSFVELINGSYTVYSKTTGALLAPARTLNQFWNSAGVSGLQGFGAFDPRVLYDAGSGHWFASSLDSPNGTGVNNRLLIAVSNTSDPTAGWKGFAITDNTGRFNDFDMLGLNGDALYVGTNNFTGNNLTGISLFVAPKTDLIAGSVANAKFLNPGGSININPTGTGPTPHPVFDLNNGTGSESILTSDDSANNLRLTLITGTNTTSPVLDTSAACLTPVTAQVDPPPARQPGGPNTIDTGDTRFSGNVIKQGAYIWGVNSVTTGGRTGIAWYRLNPTTNAIVEQGTIADANRDYYMPSISVNPLGDLVIGYTASSDLTVTGFNGFASAFASVGKFNGTITTINGTPLLLKQGTSRYSLTDNSGINRWGDYSATTLDPSDPFSFWTIQEWAAGIGTWSTQITQITFAAPVTVAPEPGSLPLIGAIAAGLAPVLGVRRRRGCRLPNQFG